jgi:hypothetical protein
MLFASVDANIDANRQRDLGRIDTGTAGTLLMIEL